MQFIFTLEGEGGEPHFQGEKMMTLKTVFLKHN